MRGRKGARRGGTEGRADFLEGGTQWTTGSAELAEQKRSAVRGDRGVTSRVSPPPCLPRLGDSPGAKSPVRRGASGPASAQQTVRGRGEGGEENHPVSSPAPTADHVPGLSREL